MLETAAHNIFCACYGLVDAIWTGITRIKLMANLKVSAGWSDVWLANIFGTFLIAY